MVQKHLKSGSSYCLVKKEPGNHCVMSRSFVQHGLVLTAVPRASAVAAAKEQRRQLWSVQCEMLPKNTASALLRPVLQLSDWPHQPRPSEMCRTLMYSDINHIWCLNISL